MLTIVFGMLLKGGLVTLPKLLLLVLIVLAVIASPLAIILASRWEELGRKGTTNNTASGNVPAF